MQIEGAVCVVTGGASGIGRALAPVGESLRRKVGDYDAWIDRTAQRVAAMRGSMP